MTISRNNEVLSDADRTETTDLSGGPAINTVLADRPAPPQQWYVEESVTSTGAATLYTSGDVSMYNRFTMALSSTGTETCTIGVSVDGTNFVDIIPFDVSTGAAHSTANVTTDGIYYVDGKYNKVRIIQAGAGTPVVYWSHGNM